MARHNAINYPVEKIRDWIDQGKTQTWIGQELGVNPKLIYKVCKKHGIKCQRTGPRAAEGHPEWKGGVITTPNGYIKVFQPDHPKCQQVNEMRKNKANGGYYRKQKYVWEHRLVMEKQLGRYLLPSEVVHHVNGVRDDNRPENLVVFQSNAEHLGHELSGKRPNWTKDGIRRLRAATERRKSKARQRKALDAAQKQETPDRLTA